MGYEATTFTGYATLTGPDGEEHDLKVRFSGETGTESHPYGSTTATEYLSEITDIETIWLDEEEVEQEEIEARFGKGAIEDAIAKAEDGADEDR